jgi:hypothetical protein
MDFICTLSALVLAQAEAAEPVVRQSYLSWMYQSLGPIYILLLPLSGFMIFVGACLVVALNRRPGVIASYLVFVPLPLLIGVFASVHGLITALAVIAMSDAGDVPVHVWAEAWSVALLSTFVGFFVSAPSYAVVSLGLFLRTLAARPANHVEAQVK